MDKSNGKRLLVVNTGSRKKRFTLRRLNDLGYELIILNTAVNWARSYAAHWILADTTDHDACVKAARLFFERRPELFPDGSLTFWDDDVLLASRIRDALGLIGVPYEVARRARDKHRFRAFCRDAGLLHPGFVELEPDADLESAVAGLKFPLVVKPIFGSSSSFVIRVDDLESLRETVAYVAANILVDAEPALYAGTEIMAEEYIDGNEVDIDILLQNGKFKFWSISDNDATREPYFVETGQCIPSRLSAPKQEELVAMAEEVLERLGVENGCIHFEA